MPKFESHIPGLTPPHVCVCPKPGPEFPLENGMISYVFV